MIGRLKNYTQRGITRVPCAGCGKPSQQQFQICALGRRHVAVCSECDIGINRVVLEFLGVRGGEEIMGRYTRRMIGEAEKDKK